MHNWRLGATGSAIMLSFALIIAGSEGGSAARAERQPRQSPPVLRRVADVSLPGGTARFDYQSLDDASGRLYLAHMGAGQAIVFDTRSGQVLTVIDSLPGVTGIWVVPQLGRLYASATGLHRVVIIDTRSFAVIARVGRIGFPDGIAYAPVVRKIFVSDEAGGRELVIDAARSQATGVVPLGGEAGNTIYDPGSGWILVAVQTRNEVVAIDPATERVVRRYPLAHAEHPHGLSVDPARRLLFVANEGDATLLTVDLRTMRVTQRQPVGDGPDVLTFDPGWRRLYVAAESGVVTVFQEEGDTLVRVGSISMPGAHSAIVSPSTHLVYFPLRDIGGRPVLRIMASAPPKAGDR